MSVVHSIKFFSSGIVLFLLFGVFCVYGQKQNSSEEKELPKIADRAAFPFGKISSTKIVRDEGNYLVSIRRLTLSYEAADQRKEKKMVAIQLKPKYAPPILNCCETSGFIGDQSFIYETQNLGKYLFIVLEQKVFNSLKDNSLIYFVTINLGTEQEKSIKYITDSFKDGEPETVRGEKFGRLNKKLAKKNPIVKIKAENLTKWLYNLPDNP